MVICTFELLRFKESSSLTKGYAVKLLWLLDILVTGISGYLIPVVENMYSDILRKTILYIVFINGPILLLQDSFLEHDLFLYVQETSAMQSFSIRSEDFDDLV